MDKTVYNDLHTKQLVPLRDSLLTLHAELLKQEKTSYEDGHGRIKTAGEYYSLVTKHPQFRWLRELSTLVVAIDELIATAAADPKQLASLLEYVKAVLSADKNSENFSGKYYAALQNNSQVAVAHGRVMHELKILMF